MYKKLDDGGEQNVSQEFSISKYVKSSIANNKLAYGVSILAGVLKTANNIAAPYLFSRFVSEVNDDDSSDAFPWFLGFVASWTTGKLLQLVTDEMVLPVDLSKGVVGALLAQADGLKRRAVQISESADEFERSYTDRQRRKEGRA